MTVASALEKKIEANDEKRRRDAAQAAVAKRPAKRARRSSGARVNVDTEAPADTTDGS